MKYAILALGLLITPVQAAVWSHDDCAVVEAFFDSAFKEAQSNEKWPEASTKCEIPISVGWRGIRPVLDPVLTRHHVPPGRMNEIGHKVCLMQMTVLQATRKICSKYRPNP